MKKCLHVSVFVIGLLLGTEVQAQPCDPVTPVFIVDLTGSPDSNWYSPSIRRDGYCCNATGSDVCIEFILTLDTGASGIAFNIASGAVPPGALYYQVNCGVPIPVGQQICLNGAGPHLLTFCKPGNNQNSFSITSIPVSNLTIGAPSLSSPACNGLISIHGLEEATITVTSIPTNALYESFLDCPTGCDTVFVTPSGTFPSFVDYLVCGNPVGGCATGILCDTVRVYFSTDVSVNISPPSALLCNGTTSTTLVANPSGGTSRYSYLWSNGQTTQSIVAGAGTHTVTVTDSGLCAGASDAVTITVMPPMVANAGSDFTVCANQASIPLAGSVQIATGGTWHGSGNFSPSNSSLNASYTPTATELASGFAVLILETTGNQGCPGDFDTVRINFAPLPVPVVAGPAAPCINGTATYTVAPVPGITSFWNVSGGTVSGPQNTNSVNVTWGNGSSGSVTLTQTSALGCIATQTYPVTLTPLPVPVISGNPTSCESSIASFAVNATPGSTYAWQVAGGTANGTTYSSVLNVTWTASGSGSVVVEETNSAGCVGTSSFFVTLLPPVIANAGADMTVCANQQTVQLSGNIQGATGMRWHGNGSFNPENTVPNPDYTPAPIDLTAGYALLILETTGNQGCPADFDTVMITFSPVPTPFLTGTVMLCANSVTNYSIPPGTGNTYFWSAGGGTINGSNIGPTASVTWSSSGSGTITVTQTTAFGCSGTHTLNVTMVALPTPVITGNANICQYSTEMYSINATAGSTYEWTVNGGTLNGSANGTSVSVTWNTNGTGSLIVVETNSFGCEQTYALPVIIKEAPAPEITGSGVACTGSTYSYSTVAATNTNYMWNVSGGTIVAYNGNSGVSVLWSSNGTNTLSLTAVNTLTGCDSTITLDVEVASISPPVVQASSTNGCPPLVVTFSGNNPTAGQTYGWSFGDIFFSAGANPTHTYLTSGTFNLVLVTQNNTGCSDTATATIHVYPTPDASFTQNHESEDYYVDEDTLSIVNTSTGATHYLWTFGTADTSNVFEPPYNYLQAGDYTIKLFAYSAQGCVDSAESPIRVRVREHIYVPNAFSPNEDHINDYFSIRTENIASLEINIFNRWGRIFYSSNDLNFRWDGTFHGNQVPLGIYVYQIKAKGLNGSDHEMVGTLSLIR